MKHLVASAIWFSLGHAAVSTGPRSQAAPARAGFSLEVAHKANGKRDFVRDFAAAHQKWGAGIPDSIASTFSLAEQDGRVDVEPLKGDDIYVADVEIGTPPQKLRLAIDTGSAELWVQSTDTAYQVNQFGPWPPPYQPGQSETADKVSNATWEVAYLDGSRASGIVYHDTLRLGNFELQNVSIQSAETVAHKFETETQMSGIIGIAKNLENNIQPPAPSFIDALKAQLEDPVFTVDLRRNATGRFDFGYIDESLALDEITWLDSDPSSPHWDVKLDLTAWDGGESIWWYEPFNATVDTGTTLLFLPDVLAGKYWHSVPGMRVEPSLSNAYVFPCNISRGLPNLHFKLPGSEHVITVPGPYLNYGPVDGEPHSCWGGMQSADGLAATILGDVMLKAVFVAFDLRQNRVGFANKDLSGDWGFQQRRRK